MEKITNGSAPCVAGLPVVGHAHMSYALVKKIFGSVTDVEDCNYPEGGVHYSVSSHFQNKSDVVGFSAYFNGELVASVNSPDSPDFCWSLFSNDKRSAMLLVEHINNLVGGCVVVLD